MSIWVVELTAGVTRQSPRMFSMIDAAAPGCPSASFIIALLDRRLSTISTASRATRMPIGSQSQPQRIDRDHGERERDQHRRGDQRRRTTCPAWR